MSHSEVLNTEIYSNKKDTEITYQYLVPHNFCQDKSFYIFSVPFQFHEGHQNSCESMFENPQKYCHILFYFIFYHRGDFSYFLRYRSPFNFLPLPHPCPSINSSISTGSYHLSPSFTSKLILYRVKHNPSNCVLNCIFFLRTLTISSLFSCTLNNPLYCFLSIHT